MPVRGALRVTEGVQVAAHRHRGRTSATTRAGVASRIRLRPRARRCGTRVVAIENRRRTAVENLVWFSKRILQPGRHGPLPHTRPMATPPGEPQTVGPCIVSSLTLATMPATTTRRPPGESSPATKETHVPFAKVNLLEVENSVGERVPGVEGRLRSQAPGLPRPRDQPFRYAANLRSPMAHSHREQEEAYVVVAGSGPACSSMTRSRSLRQWDVVPRRARSRACL